MCGIFGYIGKQNVKETLIKGLKLLEYRGYDSAGIATINNEIEITKSTGNISNLEKILDYSNTSNIGIAHTRWATHGKPSVENAHPHISNNNEWAIVHNGIIENFNKIKNVLEKSYNFISETDTEVIAHLLQKENMENKLTTVINTCKQLKGSYALAILNKMEKDTIFLAKNKSPLYIANINNEVIIASDPICFADKTDSYFALNDLEFCKAQIGNIEFFNINGERIIKHPIALSKLEYNFDKQNYAHYMLKEIEETPQVLKRIISVYKNGNALDQFNNSFLTSINKIILIGCGTAYHACLLGAKYFEEFSKIPAYAYVASEFRYSNPLVDSNTLAIFVSQSGETADTIMAHELCKQKGCKTIALTNVLYSTIAKQTDIVLPVCAGAEISVASTKAYSAQIVILNILAKHFNYKINNSNISPFEEIEYLCDHLSINELISQCEFASELVNEKSLFFIGKGYDYVTCEESSLKIKEVTYINSQAYPAGELKHGFLALVEDGTIVFVIATQKSVFDKTLNSAYEAKARGAKLFVATQFNNSQTKNADRLISLPAVAEDLMPVVSVICFQIIAYFTSIKKGINPDQPRNLAKSVTVE